ncbi:MAG: AsmA-like C-terminal region-containing protein [Candidatus Omnitrophica bacterium]|nr:AsmA-like C-terminal region-containing protein [Candidatus Omnitrophota bacterium]
MFCYNDAMLKKTILLLILIFAILTTGLAYLNEVLLPKKLKNILIEKITQKIGRDVLISDLHYVPLKGLVLTKLKIFEKNQKKEPFLSVEEASISIFYIPALMQKKAIIPSLVITNPVIRITKERTQEWNFSDLLSQNQKKRNQTKNEITAYIGALNITNGIVIFSDKNLSKDPIEIIKNINLSAHLALPKGFTANIRIMPSNKNSLKLISSINYQIDSGDFLSTFNIENFSLEEFAPYIKTSTLNLENSFINIAAFDISQRNKKITAKGEISLRETKLSTNNGIYFTSTPTVSIKELTIKSGIWSVLGKLYLNQSILIANKQSRAEGNIFYDFFLEEKNETVHSSGNLKIENFKGNIENKANFSGYVEGAADFERTAEILTSNLTLKLQDAILSFSDKKHFSGNPTLKIKTVFTPKEEKERLQHSGSITMSLATLTNIPHLETIENIKGTVDFKNNQISSPKLTGLIFNTPFQISGQLMNFQKPTLDIQGTLSNINLNNFKNIFKEILTDPSADIKGQSSLNFKYTGTTKSIKNSSVEISASLKDVAIKTKKLPSEITDISGEVSYAVNSLSTFHFLPDNAIWKNLKGVFKEQKYILDGSLAFNTLLTKITIDGLKADAHIKLMPDRFTISSLKINYKNTDLLVQGEAFYPQDSKWNINVDINGNLQLEHLSELIPPFKEKFKKLDPRGLCSIKSSFEGNPKEWLNWTLLLKLTSNKVFLENYELTSVSLKFDQRDQFINQCLISALFYEGALKAEASADLSIHEMPYKIESSIQDLNLEKLKNATPLKDKEISGILQATYQGNGPLSDIHFSKGEGSISVDQGELWQLDLVQGLGKLLFIPEYKNIAFDNAQSNFVIKNEKVFIQDGILKGNQMKLNCNGDISFNGDLDLDVVSKFEQNAIKNSQSFKKTIAAILTQANTFLTVKITGTLRDPKYYIVPSPSGIIKKTKDLILDGIPNIF